MFQNIWYMYKSFFKLNQHFKAMKSIVQRKTHLRAKLLKDRIEHLTWEDA